MFERRWPVLLFFLFIGSLFTGCAAGTSWQEEKRTNWNLGWSFGMPQQTSYPPPQPQYQPAPPYGQPAYVPPPLPENPATYAPPPQNGNGVSVENPEAGERKEGRLLARFEIKGNDWTEVVWPRAPRLFWKEHSMTANFIPFVFKTDPQGPEILVSNPSDPKGFIPPGTRILIKAADPASRALIEVYGK